MEENTMVNGQSSVDETFDKTNQQQTMQDSKDVYSFINQKVKDCLISSRKYIISEFEKEIKNAEGNDFLKEKLIVKLSDIIESDLRLIKVNNKHHTSTLNFNSKCPIAPVNIRGTNLYLKNISNVNDYKKFCKKISDMLGFNSDFSDSPFNHLPKNSRIYEAIKILHCNHNLVQKNLDKLVKECEES